MGKVTLFSSLSLFISLFFVEIPRIASSASAHLDGDRNQPPVQMRAGFSLSPSSPPHLPWRRSMHSRAVSKATAGSGLYSRTSGFIHDWKARAWELQRVRTGAILGKQRRVALMSCRCWHVYIRSLSVCPLCPTKSPQLCGWNRPYRSHRHYFPRHCAVARNSWLLITHRVRGRVINYKYKWADCLTGVMQTRRFNFGFHATFPPLFKISKRIPYMYYLNGWLTDQQHSLQFWAVIKIFCRYFPVTSYCF